jgi:hypothetical protein
MEKIYHYYCPINFYYTGSDIFTIENSTKIAPPEYDKKYFTAFFDTTEQEWQIKPQILIGNFISKETGKLFQEIESKFAENYTTLDELIFNKNNECKKFYDELRNITIRNGASGEFKCNQDLSNSIDSWIRDISAREMQVYEYLYQDLIIHIPLQSCIKLRSYVSKVRNFCASLCNYHIYKISKLQSKMEIDNYNYELDSQGNFIEKFPDFIIQTINKENV